MIKADLEQPRYLECGCHSPEHTLRFVYFDDPPGFLYLHVFLEERGFFERLWLAVKYVFGYKSRFGHFTEFVFSPEDVKKLIATLKEYER